MEFVITSEIEKLVEKLANLYKSELDGSLASGDLRNFDFKMSINGNSFQVTFCLPEYWQYVEYGRRALSKRPPMEAIEEWIRIKPIIPIPINGKVPDTRQLAYLIARKIGRDGIEGKKYLTKAMYSDEAEDIIKQIKQEFTIQVIDRLVEELKTFENINN